MKKTMIRMAAAVLTAAAMLTPMTASAVYTETSFNSESTAKMLEGYTEVENGFIRDDRVFVNEDGTHFKAFHKLNDEIMFTKADGVEQQDIDELIRKDYEPPIFLTDSFFGDWEKSFAVANADLKTQVEICELLKEKGMITDCTLITERYSMSDWYGRGVNIYNTALYVMYDDYDVICAENVVPKEFSVKDALTEYAEKELEGYSVREVASSVDGFDTSYVELVPPTGTTLSEQIAVAGKIARELSISPEYVTPEAASDPVVFGSIDVYNAVWGDANCDKKATVADSVAILQSIANHDKYALSSQGAFNADTDFNGITANDARVLQEWDANK
ncbi:MAG: hypothetical protein Q4A05_03885 [Ruminococcus sp.]|nr:hypothetical protein [Ruminococcus sp.]